MNQKGFSLIEVVVSLAIAGILLVTVLLFMQVGVKTSSSATADVTLQKEAQTVLNQINEWVMENNHGIEVYGASDFYDLAICIFNDGDDAADRYVHIIFLNKGDNKLYYDKRTITETFRGKEVQIQEVASSIKVADEWKKYIFSEHVENITVDTTRMNDQIITVSVDYTLKGKTYSFTNKTKMRNPAVSDPTSY